LGSHVLGPQQIRETPTLVLETNGEDRRGAAVEDAREVERAVL
jgi:hypothetical protein